MKKDPLSYPNMAHAPLPRRWICVKPKKVFGKKDPIKQT